MLPDCSFQAVEKSIWSDRSSFGEPQGQMHLLLHLVVRIYERGYEGLLLSCINLS
jgi:hypothetical protein